jgi:hypothetical protein
MESEPTNELSRDTNRTSAFPTQNRNNSAPCESAEASFAGQGNAFASASDLTTSVIATEGFGAVATSRARRTDVISDNATPASRGVATTRG